MKTLYLNRNPRDNQTDGVLYMPSGRELQSLEQAWRDNKPFVSCIPDGVYRLDPWVSPTFGNCYIVSGGLVGKTEGARTYILVHPANRVGQLQGCIALGLSWSGDNLRNSSEAVKLFEEELAGESAMLFISGIEEHQ